MRPGRLLTDVPLFEGVGALGECTGRYARCLGVHRRYVHGMDPSERFVELVNRPVPQTHLDLMAGLIGAAFERAADVDCVLLELDRLADQCAPSFDSILSSLFGSGRLRGNVSDYGDPRNSYLHRVIERGVGIPITLSVCAIEVGRRLGVPIQGVGLPGHFLVVCDGEYADPFHGGGRYTPDELENGMREDVIGCLLNERIEKIEPVLACIVDAVSERDLELLDELERLVQEKRIELQGKKSA